MTAQTYLGKRNDTGDHVPAEPGAAARMCVASFRGAIGDCVRPKGHDGMHQGAQLESWLDHPGAPECATRGCFRPCEHDVEEGSWSTYCLPCFARHAAAPWCHNPECSGRAGGTRMTWRNEGPSVSASDAIYRCDRCGQSGTAGQLAAARGERAGRLDAQAWLENEGGTLLPARLSVQGPRMVAAHDHTRAYARAYIAAVEDVLELVTVEGDDDGGTTVILPSPTGDGPEVKVSEVVVPRWRAIERAMPYLLEQMLHVADVDDDDEGTECPDCGGTGGRSELHGAGEGLLTRFERCSNPRCEGGWVLDVTPAQLAEVNRGAAQALEASNAAAVTPEALDDAARVGEQWGAWLAAELAAGRHAVVVPVQTMREALLELKGEGSTLGRQTVIALLEDRLAITDRAPR